MRKNTKKFKATRKKTINNTKDKKGRFNSPKMTPRERNNTKGG
jgi:hypothetical protein